MANIVKKNGAVVAIGRIFLIVTLLLAWRVGEEIYRSSSGENDRVLVASAGFADQLRKYSIRGFDGDPYEMAKQDIADRTKQATVEGFIAGGLLISGIILLSLSSKHCSECGTKVAIDTVKLCGSCGAHFDRGASI